MQSIKAFGLKCGMAAMALAGSAAATTVTIPTIDIDMTAALKPIVDLMTALPTILVLLIPIALVMVIIVAVYAVGNFVVSLLKSSAKVPGIGKK